MRVMEPLNALLLVMRAIRLLLDRYRASRALFNVCHDDDGSDNTDDSVYISFSPMLTASHELRTLTPTTPRATWGRAAIS
jgi:hypothetical protein